MSLIICPGIHEPNLTESFLAGLRSLPTNQKPENILIFPTQDYPAYSSGDILQFLRQNHSLSVPIAFISFSAGVVGAIAAAWGWQLLGGQITAFIALDGWGVPLIGNFPIHRLSHDYFTHWSSALLGSGEDSFYAAPSVEHLELWRQPQIVSGWWIHSLNGKTEQKTRITAAQFLTILLERYHS
ncbi:hypothetical protein ACE1B6_25910 [Aerosakkonemataceae cyanobacterium BLCC-F154]|uniref:Alpha/beta hydrolase n=1 Tax=Floridaenema fluviatile BLCC-F154 TaxID=3153640 RepID=A0ABV4YIP0_9CYAN